MYTCRECERPVNQATELCPYCGADLSVDPVAVPEEPGKKPSWAKAALRWGMLFAALLGFLWFVLLLPERKGDPAGRAEGVAVEALKEIRQALVAYAEAQGGYPPSLEALGPAAFPRIREAAQRAQQEGYRMEYAPGPPDGDGVVRNFLMEAPHRGPRSVQEDELPRLQ